MRITGLTYLQIPLLGWRIQKIQIRLNKNILRIITCFSIEIKIIHVNKVIIFKLVTLLLDQQIKMICSKLNIILNEIFLTSGALLVKVLENTMNIKYKYKIKAGLFCNIMLWQKEYFIAKYVQKQHPSKNMRRTTADIFSVS